MFLFKGKKGVEFSLHVLVQLILIIVFVFFPLWEFVFSDHFKLFERRFVSKDVALLINTLYSAPGEVYYSYDQDGIESLGYNFSPSTVCVFYEFVDVFNYPKSCYGFFEDNKVEFLYNELQIKNYNEELASSELKKIKLRPTFIKQGSQISVGFGSRLPGEEQPEIPVASTYDFSNIIIAYDSEKDFNNILETLSTELQGFFRRDKLEKDIIRVKTTVDIEKDEADLLLILDLLNNEAYSNEIKIQRSISKKEQYRIPDLAFSQNIKRELKKNLELGQIKVQLDEISEKNLNQINVSLKITVGNFANPESKEFLLGAKENVPNLDGIAKSIYESSFELKK